MRTSTSQFEALVGFMERHGDLNKPADGPRGRLRAIELWEDLANLLNLDVAGESKSIEKWKKVWSDFKNYTKRKALKVQGPNSTLTLSELEQRVLRLVTGQAGPGTIDVEYVEQNSNWPDQHVSGTDALMDKPVSSDDDIKLKDLEMPHGSGQSTPIAWEMSVNGGSPAASPGRTGLSPRPKRVYRRRTSHRRDIPRRTHPHLTTRPSSESDHRFRQMLRVFATEHLRLRRRELDQQAQWQTLFSKLTDVLNKFLDK